MKVLDLKCNSHGHAFEGWFGSEADFQDQLQRGLVECPMCGDSDVRKQLSAPRLNLSGAKAPVEDAKLTKTAGAANGPESDTTKLAVGGPAQSGDTKAHHELARMASDIASMIPPEAQAKIMSAMREMVNNSTDVGSNFAAEARRMHEGEIPHKAIKGQATREETIELLEDGIPILPVPEHLARTLH